MTVMGGFMDDGCIDTCLDHFDALHIFVPEVQFNISLSTRVVPSWKERPSL
jgi:hypothetical protein